MDPNDPRVRLERDGNVAVVTLDDPARRNALSLEVTVQLGQAVDEATADPSVGALVLTATPPAFCAGGSVDDLLNPRASLRDMYAGVLALRGRRCRRSPRSTAPSSAPASTCRSCAM